MAGYTRQSVADIINGAEITAPPLNAEFNQLSSAFNGTTGHAHDGSTGNGPKINLNTSISGYLPAAHGGVGGKNNLSAVTTPTITDDASQGYAPGSMWEDTTTGRIYICVGNTTGAATWRELVQVTLGNAIIPASHNTVDLGDVTTRFQDLYLGGGIAAAGNVSIGGTLTLLGSTSLQALTAASATVSGLTTLASVDINGGAIDGTAIGASSASTGAFTTLTASSATLTTADINGGTIDGADIGATTRGAGNFTTVNANAGITGNLTGNVTGNVTGAVTGNVTGNITSSGTSTFATVDINGGAIDGTAIGAASASTVRGTTITATTGFTGNLTGNVTGNTTGTHTGNVNATTGTTTLNNLTVNGAIDVTNAVVQNVATPTIGTDAANKSYVDAQIAATIDAAPGTLDTLNELAAALGDDPNFATTVSNSIATKVSKAGDSMTGNLSMGGNKVTGLADPTVGTDAVTKNYVDTVYGSVSSAAASATAAANSASAAEADRILVQSVYDTFDDRYLGAKASDPTLDNDGNALLTGALYFDTSNNITKVYNGSEWQAASSSIEGIKQDFLYVATAAQTVFSGADSNGNTLVVDQAGLVAVYMNGVRLIKDTDYTVSAPSNSVTLTSGAASGDRIEVEVFGNFAGQSGAAVSITGGSITGLSALGVAGNATFGDNNKAIFGAGSDLQIWHDGGNSFINDAGTGDLYIAADSLRLTNAAFTEFYARGYTNGAFELYYDNSKKLATTSTGVDVTGAITADALTVDGAGSVTGNFTVDTNTLFVDATNNRVGIGASTPDVGLHYTGDTPKLRIESTNSLDTSLGTEEIGRIEWEATKSSNRNVAASIRSRQDGTWSTATPWFSPTAIEFYTQDSTGVEVTSPRVTIDSTGRVGIGMIPTGRLSIRPSGTGSEDSHIGFGANLDTYITTGANGIVVFREGNGAGVNTERMRIDSSGNVGIGTSSPDGNLTVGSTTTSGDISIRIKGDATSRGFLMFGDAGGAQFGDIMYDHSTDHMRFRVNNAERMRINSSGNVGIGSINPQAALDLAEGAQGRGITWAGSSGTSRYNSIFSSYSGASLVLSSLFHGSTSADSYVTSFTGTTRASGIRLNWTNDNGIQFFTDTAAAKTAGNAFVPSERMRIDSSGNVLVGTTSTTTSTVGFKWRQDLSRLLTVADGGSSASFGRLTSDGDIVLLQKDGTTVGSIGAVGGDVFLGTGVAGLRFADANPSINPHNTSTNAVNDGAISLGTSSARFKDLYLSGGVYLGGTGAANLLDDYETGTWTPTITGTTSGSVAVSIFEATYTKIGDTIRLSCYLNGIDMTTSTVVGQYRISGLPFTGDPYSDVASVTFCNLFSFDEISTSISGYCNGGHIMLFKGSSVTSVTNSDTGTATSGQIMLSITYKV